MLGFLKEKVREHGIANSRQIILPIAFFTLVVLLWQYTVDQKFFPAVILPPPGDVVDIFLANRKFMWGHAVSTLYECFLAFICACAIGLSVSCIITLSYFARRAIYPNLIIFQLIPTIALAPLFILWFGIGTEARVAYGICLALFPIVVSSSTGLLNTGDTYLKLCSSLTAGRWQTFKSVRLPFALPLIFTGLRIGLTLTIIGVVVGEFVTAQSGIGYLISFAASGLETAISLAAIVYLLVVGLILFTALVCIEFVVLRIFSGVAAP